MSEYTKRNLKVFGVAVTDFEEESRRLQEKFFTKKLDDLTKEEAVEAIKSLVDLMFEINTRWFEMNQMILELQRNFFEGIGKTYKA